MYNIIRATGISAFLALLLLISLFSYAQPSRLGGWGTITVTYKVSPKISYYLELQERAQGVAADLYYHEAKGGASYTLPEKFTALFAIGDYRTYATNGNFKNRQVKEFRMWEQFSLSSNIKPLRIDHRYRIEQRWLNGNYRNRFRYRINPILPLNHSTIVPKTIYLSMFDEVFFTNRAPYFERNRFFGGVGYQFSKLFALQAGVLRQFDYRKADDGTGKNFLHTTLLFFLDKNSLFAPRHPSTLD